MADEIQQPAAEGASVVPVASGEKKPPVKIIAGAVGGVVVIILIVLLIKAVLGGGGSGDYSVPSASPKLTSDAKAAGKSYVEFQEKKRWSQAEAQQARSKKKASDGEKLTPFVEDPDEYKKKLKQRENRVSFFKDNDGELEKFEITEEKEEDEKVGDRVTGRKKYTCVVKGKDMVPDGDEKWKLEERKKPYALTLAKIEGKWLIVEGE